MHWQAQLLWMIAKVKGNRILSLEKKNHFSTSSQVKDTLKEEGLSLSTIKRLLHECKYRGSASRCNPLATGKNGRIARALLGSYQLISQTWWTWACRAGVEVAGCIVKYMELCILLRFSQMLHFTVRVEMDRKHSLKQRNWAIFNGQITQLSMHFTY